MQINYIITDISDSGLATIKYTCEIGSIIKQFYLPIEKDDTAIYNEILINVPRAQFRALKRKNDKTLQNRIAELKNKTGEFEATIHDDGNYDYQFRIIENENNKI